MSEQPQVATEYRTKWSKKKIALLITALLFLVGISLFQVAAAKVRQMAEQSLLSSANEVVNGRVNAGSIDLSILGLVEARDVEVLNAQGELLAKSKRIQISYEWSDLLKGQLGPHLVKAVSVEKPELWAIYNQNGFNWAGVVKPSDKQAKFLALVELREGRLHVNTPYFSKTAEQLTGKLDFRQENNLGISGTGKVEQSTVKIAGSWGKTGDSAITVTAAGIDLLNLGLAADAAVRVTSGILDEVTVKFGKDREEQAELQTLAGRFSGVTTVGALELSQGSARFEKLSGALQFMDGQALYRGQPIAIAGKLITAAAGENTLDFAVKMPSGDPAILLPALRTGGGLGVQGTITGTVRSPVLAGSFTLGSVQFSDMTISGVNGAFSYTQQVLRLLSSQGMVVGGSITASGDIYPDKEQYLLSISGSGLDSSRLTDKDVKGPLAFVGTASGNAAVAVVQGSFSVDHGMAYGIPFQTLSGNFVKQGTAATEISNLALTTALGTIYPEQLNQRVMEELQAGKLPAQEQLKDVFAETLFKTLFF